MPRATEQAPAAQYGCHEHNEFDGCDASCFCASMQAMHSIIQACPVNAHHWFITALRHGSNFVCLQT